MLLCLWVPTTSFLFATTAANAQHNPISQPCPNPQQAESQGILLGCQVFVVQSAAYLPASKDRACAELPHSFTPALPSGIPCRPSTSGTEGQVPTAAPSACPLGRGTGASPWQARDTQPHSLGDTGQPPPTGRKGSSGAGRTEPAAVGKKRNGGSREI